MTKRNPFLALVLLAAAVFLALGNDCGVLGQHVASFAAHYLGQLGTTLVIFVLIFSAYLIGSPPGTAVKIGRFIRERRVQRVPAPIEVVESPALSVVDRRKADDLRSAMKHLGYLKHEYDPVIASLDLHAPLDGLVRQVLQKLHQQKQAS